MPASAKVVLHTSAPCGMECLTMQATYERYIHDEFLTHRRLSRNSRSSRAVPTERMIREVEDHAPDPVADMIPLDVYERIIAGVYADPVNPPHWGANQRGMQARSEIDEAKQREAVRLWEEGRDAAVRVAKGLLALEIHKQVINYVLMPYTWITVIATATHWTNFFALRCHPDAHPAFQRVAGLMYAAVCASRPTPLAAGEWHIPFLNDSERTEQPPDVQRGMGVARCARISVVPFDGSVRDVAKDLRLYGDLQRGAGDGIGHWSPFEHVAEALAEPVWIGNLCGYRQHRKEFTNEEITDPRLIRNRSTS